MNFFRRRILLGTFAAFLCAAIVGIAREDTAYAGHFSLP